MDSKVSLSDPNRSTSITQHSSPWLILFIVLAATVAAPLNQFKVPPVMPILMDAFRLPAATAGLLMSLFVVTGVLLALPAGFIYQRLGYRGTGSIALISMIVGSAIGALSTDTGTMLFSRLIEGIGMILMSVAAPAIISLYFAPDRRGKALGIWAVWFPLGQMVMFFVAPFIVSLGGWRSLWWCGCFYAGLVGLLFYFFVKPTPGQDCTTSPVSLSKSDVRQVLGNRQLWLISFLYCCFCFVLLSFRTWLPTFLQQAKGMSAAYASFLMGLMSAFSILSCPLSGWVSDKTGSRKLICIAPMIAIILMLPLTFYVGEKLLLPLLIGLGLTSGSVPVGVVAATTEIVEDERLSGMAMGLVLVGLNMGMLLGPLVFGLIVASKGGWEAAFWSLASVGAIGVAVAWIIKMK
jgi:MFS family permease